MINEPPKHQMTYPIEAGRPSAGSSWTVLLFVTSVHSVFSMSSAVLPTIAPMVASELGVSASLVGVQISLIFGAGMISALFAGSVLRRWGACRTIQIAQLAAGVGLLLTAIPDVSFMAVGALLMGASYGFTNPSTGHLLFRFSNQGRRNIVFSIKQAGVPIGGILAGFVVPPLATAFGWQTAITLVASLSFSVAALCQLHRARWDDDRDPAAPLRQNPLQGLLIVWRIPALRWLSFTSCFFAGVQVSLTTFLVTILVEQVGFTILAAGVTFSLCQGAGLFGRLALGWSSDRIGAWVILSAVGIVLSLGTLITSILSPAWAPGLVNVFFALLGFVALSWTGIYLAQVADNSRPGDVGTTTGGSLFFNFIGVALIPAFVSSSYAVFHDYRISFVVLSVVAAIGTFTAYLAAIHSRRPRCVVDAELIPLKNSSIDG